MVAVLCPLTAQARQIEIRPSARQVGRYEKIEFLIDVDRVYANPFDPDEVSVDVRISHGSKEIVVPAFFCQEYSSKTSGQPGDRAEWYYPVGQGVWKARFAPMETGEYSAAAVLKDKTGSVQSGPVDFRCVPSSRKGFVGIGAKDPRFFEFSNGDEFFAIGQNLAFIGGGQYVNLAKAEEIFGRLSANGANFLRIWTCCQDWAMAIEAPKSGWGRSWSGSWPVDTMDDGGGRKYVNLNGDDGKSLQYAPCYPVALMPGRRYVLSGRFMAKGPKATRVQLSHGAPKVEFDADANGGWRRFQHEFVTADNSLWLGQLSFAIVGGGALFLDDLSLKEVGGGAELLREADVNRPQRGYYNQIDCFILDRVVETAAANDIYLMLCLLARDLYMKSLSNVDSAEYGQAVADAQKFMRYAVARWGYSTSVAAWEYFNEMDPGKPTDDFYDQLGRYLEQIDPYHHLRTTSTWHPSARDCRLPRIDIGQAHHYMRPNSKEGFTDEVDVLIGLSRFLRENAPDKPALIGEFGLADDKWGLSPYMKDDKEGRHFHTSLWASAFSGVSGTAMLWWWDQLDRQDAYHHYKPLSRFLEGVRFSGLRAVEADIADGAARVLGYQGDDEAYFWLFNPQATWWNQVVDKKEPSQIDGLHVQLKGLTRGNYTVQWWDTWKGEVVRRDSIVVGDTPVGLTAPAFQRDIACKITK